MMFTAIPARPAADTIKCIENSYMYINIIVLNIPTTSAIFISKITTYYHGR